MPIRTRDKVKQDLQRSQENIETAKEKLARWVPKYAEFHPEYAEAMMVSIAMLTEVQDLVKKIETSV